MLWVGGTLHAAGDIQLRSVSDKGKLEHTDIDVLFTRTQAVRWILFDEHTHDA